METEFLAGMITGVGLVMGILYFLVRVAGDTLMKMVVKPKSTGNTGTKGKAPRAGAAKAKRGAQW